MKSYRIMHESLYMILGLRTALYTAGLYYDEMTKMALLNIASLPKHVEELRISKLFSNLDLFALNEPD